MTLITERLDWGPLATFVPNKKLPIYNWFYFKEGFSRDLVWNLIKAFDIRAGQTVLDPFCGVGTTLLACKQLNINSIGIDVLPIAVLASKVKIAEYDTNILKETFKQIFSIKFSDMGDLPEWMRKYFSTHTRKDIIFFKNYIEKIRPVAVRDFFLLGLISSAVKCSWIWKDGAVLKIRKHPIPPFRKFYARNLKRMIKEYEMAPKTDAVCTVDFGDARKIKIEDESIDCVITSPPYLNQIDYTKVYLVENWFVGFSKPAIRSYLGLRESFIDKLKPVEAYIEDMKNVLKELYRVCRPGAKLALVVGNAYIEGQIIECDAMIGQLAEDIGFSTKEIVVLNKRWALEKRTKKKGILRESAVIFEK
ncbi:MAG: DNA methyltransferase [Candidatus Aenigmatarchaeota archaeon]